jgi:hypothetical protein
MNRAKFLENNMTTQTRHELLVLVTELIRRRGRDGLEQIVFVAGKKL